MTDLSDYKIYLPIPLDQDSPMPIPIPLPGAVAVMDTKGERTLWRVLAIDYVHDGPDNTAQVWVEPLGEYDE